MIKPNPEYKRFDVWLPPKLHARIAAAAKAEPTSITRLVVKIVERAFGGKRPPVINQLTPPDGHRSKRWNRVMVYMPLTLRDAARAEVKRQTPAERDGRKTGSLASAIAFLIAKEYGVQK